MQNKHALGPISQRAPGYVGTYWAWQRETSWYVHSPIAKVLSFISKTKLKMKVQKPFQLIFLA